MPSLTVTETDINHAIRRALELSGAIRKAQEKKRLTLAEVRLILACAPTKEGRPQKAKDIHDTMAVAAKKMAIPLSHLKAIKRMGCPAFHGARVHGDELLEWLETNSVDQMSTLSPIDLERLKGMQAVRDRNEFSNSVKKGQYLLKSAVENTVARTLGGARSLLQQKLEREYPAAVAGLSVVEARIKGKALFDDICTELRKLEQPWTV